MGRPRTRLKHLPPRLAEAEALLREVNELVMFTSGQKVIGGTLGKRIAALLAEAKPHTDNCEYWEGFRCNCGVGDKP